MKTIIKNKIKGITCKHDFVSFAIYHTSRKVIYRCSKCNKRKEI